jgi:hypothetical protein
MKLPDSEAKKLANKFFQVLCDVSELSETRTPEKYKYVRDEVFWVIEAGIKGVSFNDYCVSNNEDFKREWLSRWKISLFPTNWKMLWHNSEFALGLKTINDIFDKLHISLRNTFDSPAEISGFLLKLKKALEPKVLTGCIAFYQDCICILNDKLDNDLERLILLVGCFYKWSRTCGFMFYETEIAVQRLLSAQVKSFSEVIRHVVKVEPVRWRQVLDVFGRGSGCFEVSHMYELYLNQKAPEALHIRLSVRLFPVNFGV